MLDAECGLRKPGKLPGRRKRYLHTGTVALCQPGVFRITWNDSRVRDSCQNLVTIPMHSRRLAQQSVKEAKVERIILGRCKRGNQDSLKSKCRSRALGPDIKI